MKIQTKKARIVIHACNLILEGTHTAVLALANGNQQTVQKPFELDDKARYNLQKNLMLAQRIVETADKVRSGVVRELAGGIGIEFTKDSHPEKWVEWVKRAEAIEAETHSAPFLRVKRSGLKITNANPVTASAVVALEDVGILDDDTPASSEDVIPDAEAAK